MAQQVLDLDRDVVGEVGMLAVERLDDWQRVADAVEEVRVAEGDVPRPGANLAADVLEHDLARDDAEAAAVHRRDRAVAAQVPAPAARLGGAHHPMLAAEAQPGVA